MTPTVIVGNYTANDVELPLIDAPLWWHDAGLCKTASGYGKKIESRYKVFFQGKKRRIYSDCFGNSGSNYIFVKGERISVR